jgi:hypothetical protein
MVEKLPFDEFRGPIHVIAGGRDELAPLDELSSLLEGLPNANLDVIPKADHFFAAHGLAERGLLAPPRLATRGHGARLAFADCVRIRQGTSLALSAVPRRR